MHAVIHLWKTCICAAMWASINHLPFSWRNTLFLSLFHFKVDSCFSSSPLATVNSKWLPSKAPDFTVFVCLRRHAMKIKPLFSLLRTAWHIPFASYHEKHFAEYFQPVTVTHLCDTNDGNYNLSVKCSHPSKDTLHTQEAYDCCLHLNY